MPYSAWTTSREFVWNGASSIAPLTMCTSKICIQRSGLHFSLRKNDVVKVLGRGIDSSMQLVFRFVFVFVFCVRLIDL